MSNFIVQALQNQPLTIYGNGSQTRSFCYVSDLVRGLIACMNEEDFLGPVNLGNPHEIRILELASIIIETTGSLEGIENRPLPQDDPVRRRPDITLAKKQLGWNPKVSLEEGLRSTIAYFQEKLGSRIIDSDLMRETLKVKHSFLWQR
jgi:UDP-glucuronate decarboxylase